MIRSLSITLLQECAQDDAKMKALSLAFAVKAMFRSSSIYNFSYSRLADMFGISRARAKRLIETLTEMGLCRRNNTEMVFLSLNRPRANHNVNIYIQHYRDIDITDLKQVGKFLRLQIVRTKQCQIDFAVNILNDKSSPKSLKDLNKAKRDSGKIKKWDGQTDNGMSLRTIGHTAGIGKNSACNLVKWGVTTGLLTKETRRKIIGPAYGDDFTKNRREALFVSHGLIFSVLPSVLCFTTLEVSRHLIKV